MTSASTGHQRLQSYLPVEGRCGSGKACYRDGKYGKYDEPFCRDGKLKRSTDPINDSLNPAPSSCVRRVRAGSVDFRRQSTNMRCGCHDKLAALLQGPHAVLGSALLAMGVLLGACSSGNSTRGAAERDAGVGGRSSGGARLIEYQAHEFQALGRLNLERDLVIDHDDPALLFVRIAAIAVDDSGTIYVLDSEPGRVQVYDHDGTFLRSFGREGQGPGEVVMPNAIAVTDARVYVSDLGNRRTAMWTLNGDFVSQKRASGRSFVQTLTGTSGGSVVALVRDRSGEGTRLLRLNVLGSGFEEEAQIGEFEVIPGIAPLSADARASAFIEGLLSSANRNTQPATVFQATRDGVVFVSGRKDYIIDAFSLVGDQLWRIWADVQPQAFPEAVIADLVSDAATRVPSVDRSSFSWPEHLPAISSLLVDGRGRLYAFPYVHELEDAEGADHPVQVFSADGDLLFSGVMPNRRWLAAYEDYVYTTEEDPETGDPQVVRWKLVLPENNPDP